jgi:hypothetical protein
MTYTNTELHYEGCWSSTDYRQHHACTVAEVKRLQEEMLQVTRNYIAVARRCDELQRELDELKGIR